MGYHGDYGFGSAIWLRQIVDFSDKQNPESSF
jgi:hypothetical protein